MTTTSATFSSLIQQIQSLETSLSQSSIARSPQLGGFVSALDSVLAAGEGLISANSAANSGTVGNSNRAPTATNVSAPSSSTPVSTNASAAAGMTSLIAATQGIPSGPTTDPVNGPYTFAGSAYNPSNNAAAAGASQTVNGVQVIPGAPGWDPNAPGLQDIYNGMQSTWNALDSMV